MTLKLMTQNDRLVVFGINNLIWRLWDGGERGLKWRYNRYNCYMLNCLEGWKSIKCACSGREEFGKFAFFVVFDAFLTFFLPF